MTGVCSPAINISHAGLLLCLLADYLQGSGLRTLVVFTLWLWLSCQVSARLLIFPPVSEVSNDCGMSGGTVCDQGRSEMPEML